MVKSKFKLNWDQKQAAKDLGIKNVNKQREVDQINQYLASKTAAPAPVAAAPAPAPQQGIYTQGASVGNYNIPAGRYSEQEYDYLAQSGLIQLQGSLELEKIQARGLVDKEIANVQAATSRYGSELDLQARKYLADQDLLKGTKMAEIEAAAQKYGYDRDLESKKYIADQDLLRGTRVAEIEGQNRIDLQGIINAGLEKIEGMRGQTERDVATLQGEYGIKQESERQRGQKDIAKLGAESSFRNALISAFNF